MDIDISYWSNFEDRIVNSTQIILDILDETKNTATFFVVGYIAEHHPELIQKIYESGHEIGTHGYSHTSILNQTPTSFTIDLKKSIKLLSKITKSKISGHRACEFSINHKTSWAVDTLKENGIEYDSSIYPVRTTLYGVPNAPRYPYVINSDDISSETRECGILEIPISVYQLPICHYNIPIGGGFFFRLFPYFLIKHGIEKINNEGHYGILYFHPWEFDVYQPTINKIGWPHYYRLKSIEKKFKMLLKDFRFTNINESDIYA